MKLSSALCLLITLSLQVSAYAENIKHVATDILSTYDGFRNAISSQDINTYLSLAHVTPDFPRPTKEMLSNYWKDILEFYPDLNTLNIVKLTESDNCYGIIFVEEYEDLGDKHIDINMIKFIKIEDRWKVHNSHSTVGFSKTGTNEEVENKIKKEINENQLLQPNCYRDRDGHH